MGTKGTHAKHTDQDERKRQLLACVKEGPKTQEQIMEALGGIGIDSFKKLMGALNRELNASGQAVKKAGKKQQKEFGYVPGYYYLMPCATKDETAAGAIGNASEAIGEIEIQENIKLGTVRKMLLLWLLQRNGKPMTLEELGKAYIDLCSDPFPKPELSQETLIKEVRKLIEGNENSLLEEGYVRTVGGKDGKLCYELTEASPIHLVLDDDTAFQWQSMLQSFSGKHRQADLLRKIERKLTALTENETDEARVFRTVGRQGHTERYLPALKKLQDVDYRRKKIRIHYAGGKQGQKQIINFKVAMIVYSDDKDAMYLFGRNTSHRNDEILDITKIREVEVTDEENDLYGSRRFKGIYDEMFSISMEEPVDVCVAFQDVGNVYLKLENLTRTRRKQATLRRVRPEERNSIEDRRLLSEISSEIKEHGVILYRDRLRGLEDFAKYLRTFGQSVQVLAPKSLQDRIRRGIRETLEHYEKEGF